MRSLAQHLRHVAAGIIQSTQPGTNIYVFFHCGLLAGSILTGLFICFGGSIGYTPTHTHTESSDEWETKLRYAPYFSVLLPEPWYITPDLRPISAVFSFVVTPAEEKQEAGMPEWERPTSPSSFQRALNPTATATLIWTRGAACSQKYVEFPKTFPTRRPPPLLPKQTNKTTRRTAGRPRGLQLVLAWMMLLCSGPRWTLASASV